MVGNFGLAPGVIFKPLLDAGVSFSGYSWPVGCGSLG